MGRDTTYLEYHYTPVHYGGPNGPEKEFLMAEDDLRNGMSMYQKLGFTQPYRYGDVDGNQIVAAELYQEAVENEKKRKEAIKNKRWINPITNEVSAAEFDLDANITEEDYYAYNRERKLEELDEEYNVAQRILEIKNYILYLKKKLQELVDNPPEDLSNFNYIAYENEIFSVQLEILEWTKRIDYYTDPVVGYNINVEKIIPTEEEYKEQIKEKEEQKEANKSWVEKIVDGVQDFAKKHIDPIIDGVKKFIKRNEKPLGYIFKFGCAMAAIALKIFWF